jgi:hypothetical protein
MNQPYGTIHLSGVKPEHIAVSGNPAAFWGPLTYRTHPDPFSYDYFLDYQKRLRFYNESVQAYNGAVAEFNRGGTRWSRSRLAAWHANLEALEQDLGLILVGPSDVVVRTVEVYWSQAGLTATTLRNPTWSELEEFLKADDTDTLPYIVGVFDCSGFGVTLRDRAWKHGIRSAYVIVEPVLGGLEAHAFNAFETTDRGLVYVEPQDDTIAYVRLNQPYGTIHLSGVKPEYIDVSGNPAEFWGPLTYRTHPNPFSYDYFLEHQRRLRFYDESLQAYKEAVAEFNRGGTRWARSQLLAWLANLEALEQDLGPRTGAFDVMVATVLAYWN